jgi:hypothetical protein
MCVVVERYIGGEVQEEEYVTGNDEVAGSIPASALFRVCDKVTWLTSGSPEPEMQVQILPYPFRRY